ncbi:MAG: hypothetical protein IPM07_06310 [Anaerolineales bacterium]|nr:hypothetical protein [Anaerolineales bacterium]
MAERRSPLYEIHVRSAVRMVKGGGDYLFPLAYTAPAEEHRTVRQNVGMQDLTSMGEVDIKGPGAERLISRLVVASIYDLQPGQVRYTTMCRPDGRIVDDITVYKFGDEHFMIVTSSAAQAHLPLGRRARRRHERLRQRCQRRHCTHLRARAALA